MKSSIFPNFIIAMLIFSLIIQIINIASAGMLHSSLQDLKSEEGNITTFDRNVGLIVFLIIASVLSLILHVILLVAKLTHRSQALFDMTVLLLLAMVSFGLAIAFGVGITDNTKDYDYIISTRKSLEERELSSSYIDKASKGSFI